MYSVLMNTICNIYERKCMTKNMIVILHCDIKKNNLSLKLLCEQSSKENITELNMIVRTGNNKRRNDKRQVQIKRAFCSEPDKITFSV